MEPFKNIYNKKSISKISKNIKQVHPKFNKSSFDKAVNKKLSSLEMKDRVVLISEQLKAHLPKSFKASSKILIKTLAPEHTHRPHEWENGENIEDQDQLSGFLVWPLTHFIEANGLDDFETSMTALYEMTKRFTAEFAIRPFLNKNDKLVFEYLNKWKADESKHVRRLCSEGIRPNLPWGLKVNAVNKNLKRNIKLINTLKDDPEEYVRRSVANHMNDISRLDKKLMLSTCNAWQKKSSKEREWVIRHATRSLLKMGEPEALKLHGYSVSAKIKASKFLLSSKAIKENDRIGVKASLQNTTAKPAKVLIDYIIHYAKKDGSLSPKVFRWKDTQIPAKSSLDLDKQIHFKKVTTRKHYSGAHKIELAVNGKALLSKSFQLKV